MSTVIMACSSLLLHIDAAQKKENTSYPVIELDSKLHAEPKDMREAVFDAMNKLPAHVDTVLLCMGLCGGSVSQRPLPVKTIMPKVDDCITLLMHTGDDWYPNLKLGGHLYLADTIDGELSVVGIKKDLIEKYGEKKGNIIFNIWFDSYYSVDIIDTGIYDCYDSEYVAKAQENAKLIDSTVCYVDGSNILLEKLVSGRWDHQFLIGEKGQTFTEEDFLK